MHFEWPLKFPKGDDKPSLLLELWGWGGRGALSAPEPFAPEK